LEEEEREKKGGGLHPRERPGKAVRERERGEEKEEGGESRFLLFT
jgi:hypothetical protein